MSFSTSDLSSVRRKRTATERVTENGDPLVAKKKAREEALLDQPPQKKVSFSHYVRNYKSTNLCMGQRYQPSVQTADDDDEEDMYMPHTSLSSKSSHILERTDGSDHHGDASGDAGTPDPTASSDNDNVNSIRKI